MQSTTQRRVDLPDGDQLVLHDDASDSWRTGDPVALLIHGLCGSSASSYMQRISAKLTNRGLRTFRLDLRGCGAGVGLSKHPYHAGQSEDVQAAAELIHHLTPGSSLVAAGFSLGGNLILKWLGERGHRASFVTRAIAVNPPADLTACTQHVQVTAAGIYDRHFARLLCQQALATPHWCERAPLSSAPRLPRRIMDFDELFTAPMAGYSNAADYYIDTSAAPLVPGITVPTLILSSKNDPLIPPSTLEALDRPSCVRLHIAEGGGHLGYLSSNGDDPDRHWMDWRVVDWLTTRDSISAVA